MSSAPISYEQALDEYQTLNERPLQAQPDDKDALLQAYHPDYRADTLVPLTVGTKRGAQCQPPRAAGSRAGALITAPDPARIRALTVTFEPGAVIPFAETHVMEHGLYVLEGKAVYRLNQDWVEVEAGDYMWLRAFCPQACYAGGPGPFRYLLYKDVNRHMRFSGGFAR